MKKVTTVFAAAAVVCMFWTGSVSASDWSTSDGSCFQPGQKQLTIGFNTWYPGPNVGFDMAFHDVISGGAAAGFNWWPHYSYTYFRIPIVVRAAFHPFNLKVLADKIPVRDRLDVYAGFGSGWGIWFGADYRDNPPDVWGFTFRERVGATWYFTPTFYANAEEGSGLGSLNLGIGFKF
jgi:hypothetical protein